MSSKKSNLPKFQVTDRVVVGLFGGKMNRFGIIENVIPDRSSPEKGYEDWVNITNSVYAGWYEENRLQLVSRRARRRTG